MSDLVIRVHDRAEASAFIDRVVGIFAEVFGEPPYYRRPDDVARFRELFAIEIPRPGFRLVTAEAGSEMVGFAYGYSLTAETRWWDGIDPPPDAAFAGERDGRTFAIKELGVAAGWRRRQVGRRLHDALLDGRGEERATLTVRPEAAPAVAAYRKWGWEPIGRTRPEATGPEYVVMVRGSLGPA
jgi:ribosomal protein S18 acetylase RimI-like enzyme